MITDNPRELPGFKKKSFTLPYAGGEIRFEHLDGIYDNEQLVLEKLNGDRHEFSRPSVTSLICFVLDETVVTDRIIAAVSDALKKKTFTLAFIDDLEKAKEWLIKE